MAEKEKFIKFINVAIDIAEDELTYQNGINEKYGITVDDYDAAMKFWNEFQEDKGSSSTEMTEKGLSILTWMQKNIDFFNNTFTASIIGEALFISGKSVSGSMRKLVTDGYVEKIGKNPVQYSLTEKGLSYKT